MGEQSPSFQLYVDRFLAGTANLTDAEVGLYIRLLCTQWKESGLPADFESEVGEAMIDLLPRDDVRARRLAFKAIKKHFRPHPTITGRVAQPYLEHVRAEQVARREQSSEAGRRGATARWGRHGKASADAVRPHSDGNDGAAMRIDSSTPTTTPTGVATLPVRAQEPQVDRSEKSEAFELGEWWCREAAACAAINPAKAATDPGSFRPGPTKFALEHIATLRQLLVVHSRAEIERRARNLFARRTATGPSKVIVAALPPTLMDKWDWFDTAEAPEKPRRTVGAFDGDRDLTGGSDYAGAIAATGIKTC